MRIEIVNHPHCQILEGIFSIVINELKFREVLYLSERNKTDANMVISGIEMCFWISNKK